MTLTPPGLLRDGKSSLFAVCKAHGNPELCLCQALEGGEVLARFVLIAEMLINAREAELRRSMVGIQLQSFPECCDRGLVFLRLGWGAPGAPGPTPPRALWVVQAALFGAAGIVLLLLPAVARALWPWTITEPQSQLYSAFFLTLAVASLLAMRERSWAAVRWLVLMVALLAMLVLGVSLVHLARFTSGASTVVWMVVLVAEAIGCGGLFVALTVRDRTAGHRSAAAAR